MAFLRLAGVRKVFGDHVAVHTFDLEVAEGELVSFLGPSGCGKTTTLRMIAGFELPTEGTIHIAGDDVSTRPPNQRDVGMVFQSYALFPNMNVADNIAFGLRMRRQPRDRIRERVTELLELIHLPEAGRRFPYELSGGMQQRVALARALAIQPRVLLLDEPLSALDAKIRTALRAEIRAIQQRLGITTVYVTHDQEEALSLSDRVVVMSQGRIEQVGTPAEIYNRPATDFVARFVGTLNVLEGHVDDAEAGRIRVGDSLVRVAGPVAGHAGGDRIALALRPESVSIHDGVGDPEDETRNHLQGRVEEVTFLGSIVRIRATIEAGTGGVIIDRFNDPTASPPERGQLVGLAFPPEALIVIPGTGSTGLDAAAEAALELAGGAESTAGVR
jgi:putative spermidine/putrescine transport system ATP-binding protein